MTEKLRKHIASIGRGERPYYASLPGGIGAVTDTKRALFLPNEMLGPEMPPARMEPWEGSTKLFEDALQFDQRYDVTYRLLKEWTKEELKTGIREAAGTKRSLRILWGRREGFAFNARWLLEAVEAIKATRLYVPNWSSLPGILYGEDDFNSPVKELIWPCRNLDRLEGFYVAPEKG